MATYPGSDSDPRKRRQLQGTGQEALGARTTAQFNVQHGWNYRELTKELGTVTLQQILCLFFRCSTVQISEASDQVIHPTNPTLLRDVKVPIIQVSIHLRLLHISYDYTHQVYLISSGPRQH